MNRLRHSGRRALAAIAVIALAATVAACSDHEDDRDQHQTPPPVAETPTPTPTATDAFVAYVTQVVANLDDTGEPAATESIAATAPETTEPLPLPGS